MVERNPIDAFPIVELRNGQYWATPDFINFVQGDQEKLGGIDGQIEIDAAQVTSGEFDSDLIPDSSVSIAASQVISGQFANARISAPSVTQHAVPLAEVNAQTGDYTLAATDSYDVVTVSSGVSATVTIPTNADADITGHVDVWQLGAGVVTVEGASGVTVNGSDGGTDMIATQNARVRAQRLALNTWVVG
jgi:hypothetical protein